MSKESTGTVPMPRSKRGFKHFWVEVGREMKKVNWPPYRETNRLTGVVLTVCGMIVAFLVVLSMVAEFLITMLTKGV